VEYRVIPVGWLELGVGIGTWHMSGLPIPLPARFSWVLGWDSNNKLEGKVTSLQVLESAEASEKPRRTLIEWTLIEWDRQQAFHAYSDADVKSIIYSCQHSEAAAS
jgi:hypothetical protein